MSKKKKETNVTCSINQVTYNFPNKDAKKSRYGYEETFEHNGASKSVESASVKEYMNTILQLADEREFTLSKCELVFNKVSSDETRKEVTFRINCVDLLRELGFKEE